MARQARGKSMDPAKVQVFHTIQRCVRRAFLCGEDAVSGKSYDHRKQWIRAWERSGQGTKSGWLSPIEIAEANDPIGADMSQFSGHDARRASSKGFLNLTLEFYLDLLDWTGRNLASGKRGAIPDQRNVRGQPLIFSLLPRRIWVLNHHSSLTGPENE